MNNMKLYCAGPRGRIRMIVLLYFTSSVMGNLLVNYEINSKKAIERMENGN